jgi:PRTRC genetic system protein C
MPTKYVYLTGGREVTFDDDADAYKPDDIRQHWAATFPELASATWEEKKEDGVRVVTFAKKVGTKG